jgi:hypothetical protein
MFRLSISKNSVCSLIIYFYLCIFVNKILDISNNSTVESLGKIRYNRFQNYVIIIAS